MEKIHTEFPEYAGIKIGYPTSFKGSYMKYGITPYHRNIRSLFQFEI